MGDSPTFNATLIGQDALAINRPHELAQRYLMQVDVDGAGRLFVDISTIIMRAQNGSLPTKGEYFIDQSDDWFEKHDKHNDDTTNEEAAI